MSKRKSALAYILETLPPSKEPAAYSLKRHESGIIHLFEGTFQDETVLKECTSKTESICGAVEKTDGDEEIKSCLTEEEARMLAAKLGREVCGNCIRHLYAKEED